MNHLIQGQLEDALAIYETLIQDLFYYDYAEIHSTLLHLIYNICEQLSEKYAMLKDTFIEAMRKFISELKYAEVSEDILALSRDYFKTICNAVQKAKEDPKQQNSVIMAKRIKVGLEKNNYFYTRFKNYFGMSLNEYKAQYQAKCSDE